MYINYKLKSINLPNLIELFIFVLQYHIFVWFKYQNCCNLHILVLVKFWLKVLDGWTFARGKCLSSSSVHCALCSAVCSVNSVVIVPSVVATCHLKYLVHCSMSSLHSAHCILQSTNNVNNTCWSTHPSQNVFCCPVSIMQSLDRVNSARAGVPLGHWGTE